jgi:N-acetyl-anhydromuramyl-L-alanine amidase AmpD
MVRPLYDSEYIYGIHEPGGEQLMLDAGFPGWVVFNEVVGCDPDDRSGIDFTSFSERGLGVICRLNHGHEPHGTIPHSSQYEQFARRVANFVAASRGCKIWVIGNEMNYAVERPGIQIDWSRHASVQGATPEQSDPLRRGLAVRFNVLPDHSTEIRTTRAAIISPGEVITPDLYARCYKLCRDAIHRLPGHADDQVLVGAVAPWNTQTIYSGNANGDWVEYFRDILEALGAKNCDGFALHAYTHGPDPELVRSIQKLPPPFQHLHQEFRTFTDFMNAVPPSMRHLAAYITEADQSVPWRDDNSGWVQAVYDEVQTWNNQPGNQQIRAVALYRWPRMDRWYIDGKFGVIEDFRLALRHGYRWRGEGERETPQEVAAAEKPAQPQVPRYRAQWIDDKFPARLTAGQVVTVPVTVKNVGSLTWTRGGANAFQVVYHYYRNRKLLNLGAEKELVSELPETVAPGASVTVPMRIALPDQPGNYTLEVDLVHQGITTFKEQQSPVLSRWLTVEAPIDVDDDGINRSNNLPVPLFSDVAASLPRSGTPYARRSLSQIKHIVISHTGAHPWLSLERIAATHILVGYPGIVYQFVVDGRGQVYRTAGLEDVAQPKQAWSEQGVNICLTGNFSVEAPLIPQLDAAARLCAWVAHNLGLGPEAVVGLGELTRSDSPGDTFYRGAQWKSILMRQVRLHLVAMSSAGDTNRMQEMNLVVEELRERADALEAQLASVQAEREQLEATSAELQAEVKALQDQLAEQIAETVGGVRVHRWVDRLPRDASRYAPRRAQDVRFVVVNHTGAAPSAPLTELAEAHRKEWPGILYDYVIGERGEVYQCQPLDEVVATSEIYIANAINVAFAGEFNHTIPNNDQLTAGGKLIAFLLERFPRLRLEDVRGFSEFVPEQPSPGAQWKEGQNWKEMLLASVRRSRGAVEPSEVETQLRSRVAQLEAQVTAAQRAMTSLREAKQRAEAENEKLQSRLNEQQGENPVYVVPKPAIRVVVDQLPKHPTLRYERRTLSQITHIAIHHTATPGNVGPARIAELHVAADPSRGKDPWPAIGYHYYIHPDGTIDQTNHLEVASYHVYRHNLYSVGVVFAGSFMNGTIPTSAQMRSGAHLVAWLMQELNVPLARVWGHREFPDNTTVCPGSEWTTGNRWRDLLFERVGQMQAGLGVKSLRHYMLFWQRSYPGPMARQDFVNAINYVVRFRPTLGFSLHDARNAEYVTIVGSEAGISAAEEESLRASGCKVERIAGRDEEETSRMLAELANLGRRFRTFDVDF